ncbi:hypothetical protein U27_04772 [Candidatus Vecturithrix granuli]|uniref:Fibronectin type-III domain-containing protein n=1 Tax=Vecturithrix granuli TaxID=1499967 RepID=A0A081BZQ0_VECG1|nr:hypothetical protein U27_04772 [Candidatus Vecturithrix granuli]
MKKTSKRQWRIGIIVGMLICLGASPAICTRTEIWTIGTFEDFHGGEAEALSLSRAGELTLSPQIDELFKLSGNDLLVWSMAADSKGNIYVGTGDQGRIFKITPQGESSVFFDSPEISILSLVVDSADSLYAGTAPDGLIYKITAEGGQTTFFMTEDHYVWSLVFGANDILYAGTGGTGKIYRILPDGAGTVLYDSPQTHVMSLLYDPQGWLYAGTEGRGITYKVDLDGKAFALYQAKEEEIHALALDSQGNLYLAALSNKIYPQPPVAAPEEQQAGPKEKSLKVSAIYRITPQGVVTKILELSDTLIYAMVVDQQDHLILGTDRQGKMYRVFPDGEFQQVVEVKTGKVLSLSQQPDGTLYIGTGDAGSIHRLLPETFVKQGQYLSVVHDAATTATWGKIFWRGTTRNIALYTRTGNTATPDDTWSSWSPALQNKEGEVIPNPPARFIQWKAALQRQEGDNPVLEEVSVAYLPYNLAPEIKDVVIYYAGQQEQDEQGESTRRVPTSASSSNRTPAADAPAKNNGLNPPKFIPPGYVALVWEAADPNKDGLFYTIALRGAEDAVWKVLEEEVTSLVYLLDITTLADGEYYARIAASDHPDNPPDRVLTAEKTSKRFTVDNTAPQVSIALGQKQENEQLQVIVIAQDELSRLKNAQYAIDAGDWISIFPDDQVTDFREEKYTITLSEIDPGSHILTFKAIDQFGNIGVGKIQFSTDGAPPQP